jgi:hypothetical protein
MPKANEVATELRKLADALDKNPECQVPKPYIYFSADDKETFLNTARSIPRPFVKGVDNAETRYASIAVKHDGPFIYVWSSVLQTLTCELIEPAKPAVYRCDPILSEAEESMLEVS